MISNLFFLVLGLIVGFGIETYYKQRTSFNYREYLKSPKWRGIRSQVLARDKHRCQECGSKESLQVHHKTYIRIGNERLSDLVTLCDNCHDALEKKVRATRARELNG